MNTVCNCNKVHLYATDGGLRHMPSYLVPDLQKQGWKVVVNPKRNYAPEYDQTSPYYKKEGKEEETLTILPLKLV